MGGYVTFLVSDVPYLVSVEYSTPNAFKVLAGLELWHAPCI